MAIRVLVGAGKEKFQKQLSKFLQNNGYLVIGEVDDGYDYLRRVHSVYPDICIIDSSIRGLSCQELSEVIVLENIAPVILLLNEYDLQNYLTLSQEATFVPIVKPLNKSILLNTIELLVKTNRNIKRLKSEVDTLKQKKDEKYILQKAKKLLMENMHLDEEQAHRRIQKQSMDKGISKIKIAEAIILMYE